MKIKYLSILIGCVATLNIYAQDISKPVIKKTEVQTSKRTTTTESKKKAASRVVPQRKRNSSYSSSSNSYQPQLSAEEMYKKGKENYEKGYYSEAVKWLRKSAELGNATAQNDLGWMYRNGHGVLKDYTEAVKWFRKSAEQGDDGGQNNLGYMYLNGYGVLKDYTEAVKWFRKSARQGREAAKDNLRALNETW